ncbi:RNA-binding S4 domain-containing protein [Acholeplasma equirhinis]|uniref:RNA-binding S4 domain-containing protein n=1 Tax=Acholeplasma equirhinis TaxID=555393 RepID=UPI00197AD6AE|nr:RNA-binding S4 domain-containing protein [Acholeplasma equirhinis]MBN3491051.1 RNA-binding S4 domain-containing protein [Acholeplasma equirhinis]
MEIFQIQGEFITISQLLKVLDYIGSGGESKFFLLENEVLLNEAVVFEKKKKIFRGDIVKINSKRYLMK